ncbi:MAG: hypothetical protein IJU75_06400, partial [Clostridia bacterium]|nr:hypothetical protein [Clostridia bacterium]
MKKTNRIIALIVSIAMIAGVMTVLPVISTAETANPFAGDHYVYFSSIGYGRIFKFTVDSLEGSATVDSVFQSQDYDGTGRISSGGGSVTVNWTVTGESMSVVVSNFEGNPENTYLQQIDKLVVDGLSTGYTADAGNHCFSFTTTNTGSAHLLSFTNTAYGRLYVFNINGTSGTVSNLLPLLRDDTTAGWAAYVSLDSTEAVNIEYTADADGNVTLNVGGWSYPSQCSGFVAIDTLLNGNLNNNAASASGADGVLTAAFTGVALPNLAAVEEALPAPGNLLITAKDGVANAFAGDHYVYFSSIGYGRIFKFTVDSPEGSATVDCVYASEDFSGGRISSGGGSVTVNWTVTGESMSVVVSNFNGNPEDTYLQQIEKLVVDGLSTGYTADAGNHCFSFTTTNTGSAHLLSFTNTAYGRLYVFNIKGTSGTVSNLLPLLRDDTTAGWAAYVSLDSTEAV